MRRTSPGFVDSDRHDLAMAGGEALEQLACCSVLQSLTSTISPTILWR